jgi:predicted N-acyltransferase
MWKDNNIHLISDRDLRNAIENYVKTEDIKNEKGYNNIENTKTLP